jgi:branched-chain amino acid transport system substrate-binding protein
VKKEEAKEIKIGVIAPLTGDAAVYGSALKKGLDLAEDEINRKGSIKDKKVILIYEDSQADPKTAISAFNKLVNINKVKIIIGDMFSSTTLSIAPLAQKQKIVLLSPTASSEEVPKTGNFIFTIYPSDTHDGQFVGNFASSTLQKTTSAVIYVHADAMIAVKNSFIQSFSSLGGKVLLEEGYLPKTKDFRSILTKMKLAKPEIIFIPGYLEEIVKILNQAKEIGIKSQFLTISTAYDETLFSLAKNTSEGLILSAPFYDQASRQPEIVTFQESFKNKYNETPNVWAAYGYDALKIIKKSYDNSLSNNSPLTDELSKIKDFMGVTGKTTFLENRKVEKQLRMMIVNNNKFVEYR